MKGTGPNKREVLARVWRSLEQAGRQHDHPWRTPVLGTAAAGSSSKPGSCRLRTVVLREASRSARALVFHTDIRSPKCRAIENDPLVQWLFYDHGEKIQIKALARAEIHHQDDRARRAWKKTPLPSRVNYLTPRAPGRPLSRPGDAWSSDARPQHLTREASEAGWKNFALVATRVVELELLQLSPEGHHRARFSWPRGRLRATWIVP